ncbi:energy-coupling factor transport system permease protein [Frondihabitans sp. PhB188]|uniref:energy-coupling factor transporter transmembrane component T family protein n=1 Tax=Frondihabitans sp. PhB188 TaxID=2485200 RepID=UPI000F48DE05|nr:energy-coupling factor transporter transmembrane component T [Frondihabitans sp. PhB188]ROQ38349.1 energy-coupling factor transport system permease protein [Frondihabitans sp. PhB188]
MTVLATIATQRAIGRVNPVAKLLAAVVLSLTLLLSIDWVSAGVALVLEAGLLAWSGLTPGQLLRRTAPLWIAAPLAFITTCLYGRDSGATLLTSGFITVTQGSVALGLAIGLRILAIGIPGIVLFATTDPTDLADGLAQVLRLPSRFVLGALAGIRLVGLFQDDWRQLGLARRARGVADVGGLIGRIRRGAGMAFALLVLSVRRGSKLATAMEARGFGSDIERTWARPSTFGRPEWTLVATAALIAAVAVVCAVGAGTWEIVVG